LAGQRELIAEYLQNEVFKPLNDLVKNSTSERKKLMSEGQELQRKLRESMEQLENVSDMMDTSMIPAAIIIAPYSYVLLVAHVHPVTLSLKKNSLNILFTVIMT
jgi:uncharacterized protein (UPF0305 family)